MKKSLTFLIPVLLFFMGCKTSTTQENNSQTIDKTNFTKLIDGKEVSLYMLGSKDFKVAVTNYGARLVSIVLPDKNGKPTDVVLGFNSLDEYIESTDAYFGPIVGRFSNRIAKGKFTLNGKEYSLTLNNRPNHLHGGLKGLHKVVWDVVSSSDSLLVLHYLSPNMEEGYPGNLDITVTYSTEDGNTLDIAYKATTDEATPVNLTSHVYYNLSGKSDATINDHLLHIYASNYTPVDSTLIPLGNIAPVAGTPFDFTSPKTIGDSLEVKNAQLFYAKGYDHNWVLDRSSDSTAMNLAAEIYSPVSGIQLTIYTQEPAIQFYGGNFFDGTITGRDSTQVGFRSGFALEPQHFPDAVNEPSFPNTILNPGETYQTQSKYVFKIRQ